MKNKEQKRKNWNAGVENQQNEGIKTEPYETKSIIKEGKGEKT